MLLYQWLVAATKDRGSARALVYRDTYLSWRGLQHRVERRALEFQSLGIQKGHWVGLMLGNVNDFAILALALSKIGATVVPLDPTTGPRDLQFVLERAPLRALITRPRGGIDAAAGPVAPRPILGENIESRRKLQRTLLTCNIYKAPKESPGKAEVVLFTNDPYGEPKGVMRTEDNLEATAKLAGEALEITPDDRILTTVPLYHAYGFHLGLVLALKRKATLHLEDEIAPDRLIKVLKDHEINVLPGSPTLYAGLAKVPTAKPLKLKNPRYLAGGSPLSDATVDAFKERWGIRVLPTYHTTEAGLIAIDRKPTSSESVGKLIEGVEVRFGSDPKKKAAASTEAEPIWVKSKAVSESFVGARVKKTVETPIGSVDAQGWLRTGDRGRLDKNGRLILEGREDDTVKVDGKRVALREVHECLESYSKIDRAEVRVVDDPIGGPLVVASVVATSRATPQEILDHCAKNLAHYKVPRRVEFVKE